jgi:hypothetical protein
MGLKQRQLANEARRARGQEPAPGCGRGASVHRWARYHKRVAAAPIKIKNPERYLSAYARARLALAIGWGG